MRFCVQYYKNSRRRTRPFRLLPSCVQFYKIGGGVWPFRPLPLIDPATEARNNRDGFFSEPHLTETSAWDMLLPPPPMEVSTWNVLLSCVVWAPVYGGECLGCVVPLVREPPLFVMEATKVTVTRMTTLLTRFRNLQVGFWLHPTTLTTSSVSALPVMCRSLECVPVGTVLSVSAVDPTRSDCDCLRGWPRKGSVYQGVVTCTVGCMPRGVHLNLHCGQRVLDYTLEKTGPFRNYCCGRSK